MEPLRELDVNCLAGQELGSSLESSLTESSAAASSAAKTLLARIDLLRCGGSWKVREMWVDERYVVLEVDWYEFRSHFDGLAASLVQVTKTEGTAVLVLYARLQEVPGCWHWLRIRLNRVTSPSHLQLSLPHLVSADSRSVVLPEVTFKQLREEVLRNSSLTWRGDELPAPLPAPLPTAGPLAALPETREALPQTQAALQTQELHLTKTAVTYLIGPAGERIESTRLQSQATIKVLPISAREQARLRSLPQTLALTGDRQQIATAMALIEAQLNLHQLAPNHQL